CKARNKTAAANVTAALQSAVDAKEVAPRRKPGRFALEQPPEHDPIAVEQRAGDVLDSFGCGLRIFWVFWIFLIFRVFRPWPRTARQRPAAGILDSEGHGASAAPSVRSGSSLARWHEQGAQSGKTVGGHET